MEDPSAPVYPRGLVGSSECEMKLVRGAPTGVGPNPLIWLGSRPHGGWVSVFGTWWAAHLTFVTPCHGPSCAPFWARVRVLTASTSECGLYVEIRS